MMITEKQMIYVICYCVITSSVIESKTIINDDYIANINDDYIANIEKGIISCCSTSSYKKY